MTFLRHGESEAEQRVLRGILLAVELSVVILVLESVGVYFSHSLSLAVDAVHNAPDILAFSVSYVALRGTRAGPSHAHTFGTHRLEVFAGLLNGLLVLVTGVVFGYEAVTAIASGGNWIGAVDGTWLLAAALPTLGLRTVSLRVLGRLPGRVRDLNLRSVIVHLASDLAIAGAVVVAAALLLLNRTWTWADPLGALAIAGILVYEGIPLLRDGWDVLTERAPRGISAEAVLQSALTVPGVVEVHDVHVWSVCSSLVCLTAHVGVEEMTLQQSLDLIGTLRSRMEREFGILHATFEVERVGPPSTGATSAPGIHDAVAEPG